MKETSRIYIAGHRGLVGSAMVRCLRAKGYDGLVTRTHADLDLERQGEVDAFFAAERPEYVFLAAAKVGGIYANNTYPVDFLLRNLKIQNNVIESAWRHGVKGLLFLGSSCIYPKCAPQPLKEEYLLSGPLEPTNEPYAVAKIAGIELCESFNRQYGTRFISVMPTNLYGANDNYDLETSHVLPALLRKFHLAKMAETIDREAIRLDEEVYGPIPRDLLGTLNAMALTGSHGRVWPGERSASGATNRVPGIEVWGTGTPRREFLHADDAASACVFIMEHLREIFDEPSSGETLGGVSVASRHLINIGCGEDLTIRELARLIAEAVGYTGPIEFDPGKPDGTPQKLLDVSRIQGLGWKPVTDLREGIRRTYEAYLAGLSKNQNT